MTDMVAKRRDAAAGYVVGSLLDVGCGLDPLPGSIGLDASFGPLRGSVLALPIRDNAFDTVAALEVIEHVTDPSLAVSEITRVARQRVIITVPHCETIGMHKCIWCHEMTPSWGHLHTFSESDIAKLIPDNWTKHTVDIIYNPPSLNWGSGLLQRFPGSPFYIKRSNPVGKPRWWLLVIEPKLGMGGSVSKKLKSVTNVRSVASGRQCK